jgi:membrane-anchored protein YejM (alkaline phosphatase superfamily)
VIFDIDLPRLRQVASLSEVEATLQQVSPRDVVRPQSVFLFLIDSLRADAISPDGTPNLHRLKQRALPVRVGVAASNVTHISWFSIAHGTNPLYWSVAAHQEHSPGAAPLRVLRRLGYEIRAVSSPSLEYFGFERSVFGEAPGLAASVVDARTLRRSGEQLTDGDLDDMAMKRLTADLGELQPGSRTFYLVVLHASHHDYTWSARYTPRYLPFTSFVSVFKTAREDIGPLKNRYRNSLAFIDMLMGEFLQTLEARGLADSSIVAVTGDHGEEFFEMGNLVHSSSLNRFQTHVPIIIALPPPASAQVAPIRVASHLDIFPTFLDALGVGSGLQRLLHGRSLLRPETAPAAFSAMASSYSPTEAIIDTGDYKLFLQVEGARKVGRQLFARRLVGTRVATAEDKAVKIDRSGESRPSPHPTLEQFKQRFRPALMQLLADHVDF